MKSDLKNIEAVIFGEPTQLIVTKSGYYTIPTNQTKAIQNNTTTGTNTNVTLLTAENKLKNDITLKLQQQLQQLQLHTSIARKIIKIT